MRGDDAFPAKRRPLNSLERYAVWRTRFDSTQADKPLYPVKEGKIHGGRRDKQSQHNRFRLVTGRHIPEVWNSDGLARFLALKYDVAMPLVAVHRGGRFATPQI